MTKAVLGIIGGSGIYDLPGLEGLGERRVSTPWREPSDINYRANVDAMKRAGATGVVSFSACGSFREELSPGTFVLVDNFVDRTVRRTNSLFGAGCVAHVPFAHPVGPALQALVVRAAEADGIPFHRGGTAVCMEGPQVSTLTAVAGRVLGGD